MRSQDDVTVRRDDVRDAVGAVVQRVRNRPSGDVTLAPGEAPGTVRFQTDLAVRTIAGEGFWRAHLVVSAERLWLRCQPGKLPMQLRLTFFDDTLMVGPTALAVLRAWPDGSLAAQGELLPVDRPPAVLVKRRPPPNSEALSAGAGTGG
jgi:hypothetical protein